MGSAMGSFHKAIATNLMSRDDVVLRYIEIQSFAITKPGLVTIFHGLSKLARDAVLLLRDTSEIVLMTYPAIPLVPLTTVGKLPVALLSYLTWFIKRHITGQRFVLVIADLPLEQAEDLGISLGIRDGLYRIFEKVLFSTASWIVVPSDGIAEYIVDRYRVSRKRLLRYRVYAYPTLGLGGRSVVASTESGPGLRLLYAGDLRRPQDRENILEICALVGKHPSSRLSICGPGGGFLDNALPTNVEYMGVLDPRSLDALASSCDVGLILYPTTHRYYHWAPTSKYSTYVANGLAVLSTRLETIEKNLIRDGVGLALDWQDLCTTLEKWMEHPELVLPFKREAKRLSAKVRSDFFVREWLDPILEERKQ